MGAALGPPVLKGSHAFLPELEAGVLLHACSVLQRSALGWGQLLMWDRRARALGGRALQDEFSAGNGAGGECSPGVNVQRDCSGG